MHFQEVVIHSYQAERVAGFYQKMGAKVEELENGYGIEVGNSILRIQASEKNWTYHLAFNIPHNQIEEAKNWMAQFAEIQKFQGKEIVSFPKWGAEAIYFYDPAGNILEMIARKPMKVQSRKPFSFASVINISEVGWPVKDVEEAEKMMQLPVYSRFGPAFSALGDAEGLFIVVDANIKKWIPNDDEIQFSPCRVKVRSNGRNYQYDRKAGVQTFRRTVL